MSLDAAAKEAGEGVLPQSLSTGLTLLAVRALANREDAADAVQETLTRALGAIRENRIPAGAPLGAFVYGIARHVIADILRARMRERHNADCEGLAAIAPSSLDALVREEECAQVNGALARLPAQDQALLRRCYVNGERIVDIAEREGEPAERIRKRKSRALARLREELGVLLAGHVSTGKSTDPV